MFLKQAVLTSNRCCQAVDAESFAPSSSSIPLHSSSADPKAQSGDIGGAPKVVTSEAHEVSVPQCMSPVVPEVHLRQAFLAHPYCPQKLGSRLHHGEDPDLLENSTRKSTPKGFIILLEDCACHVENYSRYVGPWSSSSVVNANFLKPECARMCKAFSITRSMRRRGISSKQWSYRSG